MSRRGAVFGNVDKWIVAVYFILVAMGWLNIFSSTCGIIEEQTVNFSLSTDYGRQMVFMAVAFLCAFIILLVDGKLFAQTSYVIYVLFCLLLVAVLVVGEEVSGARSWIKVGSFSIQPAEFAKFATALAVSRYLSDHDYSKCSLQNKLLVYLFPLIPIGLIMLEPDAGSALVFFSFLIPLFREGFSGSLIVLGFYLILLVLLSFLIDKYILLGAVLLLLILMVVLLRRTRHIFRYAILIFIVSVATVFSVDYGYEHILQPHQKDRIEILLGMKQDIKGAGYNVHQSKIAIGSGGFAGKGYLKGTQTKFDFVPEQQTDFIFCTVGEEEGFIGSLAVLGLFLFLIIRIIIIAERQRTKFSRIYGYCVAGIFFFHVWINISMTIGLMPVIGIPLPFFSYGGSSLMSFTILLFIFVKLDAYRYDIL